MKLEKLDAAESNAASFNTYWQLLGPMSFSPFLHKFPQQEHQSLLHRHLRRGCVDILRWHRLVIRAISYIYRQARQTQQDSNVFSTRGTGSPITCQLIPNTAESHVVIINMQSAESSAYDLQDGSSSQIIGQCAIVIITSLQVSLQRL